MAQIRLSPIDLSFLNGLAVYVVLNLAWSGIFYFDSIASRIPLDIAHVALLFLVISIAFGPPVAILVVLLTHSICALKGIRGPRGWVSLVVVIMSVLTSCLDLVATARIFAGI